MKKYFDELPFIYALFVLLCYLLGVVGWISSVLYDYSWSFLLFSALLTSGAVLFVIINTNPDVDEEAKGYGYNLIRLLMLPLFFINNQLLSSIGGILYREFGIQDL